MARCMACRYLGSSPPPNPRLTSRCVRESISVVVLDLALDFLDAASQLIDREVVRPLLTEATNRFA